MSHSYAPGSIIEAVPMFPLPGVVLFPKTLLPLHIFEPRYRRMTEDALSGSRQLVMGCITGGSVPDKDQPAVFSVAGIGEIVESERLPDGRFNLVLLGQARVRIHELPFVPPYRRVRAEVLPEGETHASECDMAALVSSATRLFASLERPERSYELPLPSDSPGALAGVVGSLRRSDVHRFRFPPQDCTILPGNEVRDPRSEENPGAVHAIDPISRTIDIARGKNREVPTFTALIPYELVGTKELRESLCSPRH